MTSAYTCVHHHGCVPHIVAPIPTLYMYGYIIDNAPLTQISNPTGNPDQSPRTPSVTTLLYLGL